MKWVSWKSCKINCKWGICSGLPSLRNMFSIWSHEICSILFVLILICLFFRSQLAIIPQNPFIFSGSIRENIDPLTEHQDSEIWTALQRCCLHNTVKRLGGLSVELGENGVTLSAGQKQLLCLVRAVLHNAKVNSLSLSNISQMDF